MIRSDKSAAYFTTLSEVTSIDRVGGKAKNLAQVQAHGVPIPRTIVLECRALRSTLETSALDARVREYLRSFDSLPSTRLAKNHQALVDAVLAARDAKTAKAQGTANPWSLSAICVGSHRGDRRKSARRRQRSIHWQRDRRQ